MSSLKCVLKKPKPMNTNDLMVMASRKYGLDSDRTRIAAEKLYGKGLISYPRTQGREYFSEDDIVETLRFNSKNKDYGEVASELQNSYKYTINKAADEVDHPPITPVANEKKMK